MPSEPRLYLQETPESCVAACLRMVLSAFGRDVPEEELRRLCDCTVFGTGALKAVDAARRLGFEGTRKYTLTLQELTTVLEEGRYPIVFVGLEPIDGTEGEHALVVVEMTDEDVRCYGPMRGVRWLPIAAFSAAWAMMHQLALIVEQ